MNLRILFSLFMITVTSMASRAARGQLVTPEPDGGFPNDNMAADNGALPSAAGGAVYTWNSSSRFLRVIGCITITDGSDSVKYWKFIADKLSAASWTCGLL
jgi:hypothetical protein